MLKVSLSTMGLDALPRQVPAAALELTLAGATATAQAAREAVVEIHGTGVKYPALPNQSSSPGQAPQDQRGDEGLLGTIGTSQEGVEGIGANAVAGDGSGEATALEGGTSRMAPRPFMGPAAIVGQEAVAAMLPEVAKTLGRT